MGENKKPRKITSLKVSFISIVDEPATGKKFTLKSKDGGALNPIAFRKTNDELQIAYGIVYAPNQVDSHGDYADAAVIRTAAERFMRDARTNNVDVQHDFDPADAYVCESWIVRSGDPLFGDEPEGAWAVGVKVLDPKIWKALKAGNYTGFSLAGLGTVEADPDPADEPTWIENMKKWFEKLTKETEPVSDKISDEDVGRVAAAVFKKMQDAGLAKGGDGAPQPAPAAVGDAAAVEKRMEALEKTVAALPDKLADAIAKATAKGEPEGGAADDGETAPGGFGIC